MAFYNCILLIIRSLFESTYFITGGFESLQSVGKNKNADSVCPRKQAKSVQWTLQCLVEYVLFSDIICWQLCTHASNYKEARVQKNNAFPEVFRSFLTSHNSWTSSTSVIKTLNIQARAKNLRSRAQCLKAEAKNREAEAQNFGLEASGLNVAYLHRLRLTVIHVVP